MKRFDSVMVLASTEYEPYQRNVDRNKERIKLSVRLGCVVVVVKIGKRRSTIQRCSCNVSSGNGYENFPESCKMRSDILRCRNVPNEAVKEVIKYGNCLNYFRLKWKRTEEVDKNFCRLWFLASLHLILLYENWRALEVPVQRITWKKHFTEKSFTIRLGDINTTGWHNCCTWIDLDTIRAKTFMKSLP